MNTTVAGVVLPYMRGAQSEHSRAWCHALLPVAVPVTCVDPVRRSTGRCFTDMPAYCYHMNLPRLRCRRSPCATSLYRRTYTPCRPLNPLSPPPLLPADIPSFLLSMPATHVFSLLPSTHLPTCRLPHLTFASLLLVLLTFSRMLWLGCHAMPRTRHYLLQPPMPPSTFSSLLRRDERHSGVYAAARLPHKHAVCAS